MKHFKTLKKIRVTIFSMREDRLQFHSIWSWHWQRNKVGMALGMSQTIACLDVFIAFLHVEMRDEVCVKLNAVTLQLIREDSGGVYRMDKALYGYRGPPQLWKDAVSDAAKDLGLKPSKIDKSLHMDRTNFLQYVHVDEDNLSEDDRIVRDLVHKIETEVLGEE